MIALKHKEKMNWQFLFFLECYLILTLLAFQNKHIVLWCL